MLNDKNITRGLEYQDPNKHGMNKLHRSLLDGDVEKTREYLGLGVNPNIKDSESHQNAIVWAIKGGSLECLRLLKKYIGLDDWCSLFQEQDKHHNLPLHIAAAYSDNVVLFEFIHKEGGYTLLEKGCNNWCILNYVYAKKNNDKVFDYVVTHLNSRQRKSLVYSRSLNDVPTLHWLVFKNRIHGVRTLLRLSEIDVNQPGSSQFTSSLHIAAEKGYTEIIKLLIENDADANYEDLRMKTPILAALDCKKYKAAELLLQLGANVNYVFSSGDSLVHILVKHVEEDIKAISFLLSHGASDSILIEDVYGFRPFEWLSTDVNTYIDRLEVSVMIKVQIKDSYRYKAEYVSGKVLHKILINKYPELNEHIEGGMCNAYGWIAAKSYFDNGSCIDVLYQDLKKTQVYLSYESNKSQQRYIDQWINDILWLQSTHKLKEQIFKKENVGRTPRYHTFFSQSDRIEQLCYVSKMKIYGPNMPLSFFFDASYDGGSWIMPELEKALIKRLDLLQENEVLEIYSQNHTNLLIKKESNYIFLDQSVDNKIINILDISDIVNLLIHYHYAHDRYISYLYNGLFPFHLRIWSFGNPRKKNKTDYVKELKHELISYLQSNDKLNEFSSENRHILHFCAKFDDLSTMQALLQIKPTLDINVAHRDIGASTIHYAVTNCAYRCVEFLMECPDIDIYCKDINDKDMLVEAYKNEKMLTLILNKLSKRGIEPRNINKGDFKFRFFVMAGGDKELIDTMFTPEEYAYYQPYFNRVAK